MNMWCVLRVQQSPPSPSSSRRLKQYKYTKNTRTEAQQRGALHSHILVWFRKRRAHPNWSALPVVPRTVNGTGPKQRHGPRGRERPSPEHQQIQHDSCYQQAEMGRVSAEMIRPTVTPGDFGGYDVEMLRMASLSRTILIRLNYLHICSPVYCLKDISRASMCATSYICVVR